MSRRLVASVMKSAPSPVWWEWRCVRLPITERACYVR
jgi:hypothetical protein